MLMNQFHFIVSIGRVLKQKQGKIFLNGSCWALKKHEAISHESYNTRPDLDFEAKELDVKFIFERNAKKG